LLKEFSLTINSSYDELLKVEEFFSKFFKENNLDENLLGDVLLAVSEAATNAIVHGNKLQFEKEVKINVSLTEEKMSVKIKDEGNGFKIDQISDPTKPENLLKESGRGIFIMKNCVHNISYNFTPQGTEVILEIDISK